MFDNLLSLTKNVVSLAVAPVEAMASLVDAAVQPLADVAKELKEDIKSIRD